jgi:hypothetical protein
MNKAVKYGLCTFLSLASVTALASPTSVTWSFDLPSTSVDSQSPPYPTVATMELTQVGSDVQFVLNPNEASPGVADPATSFVDKVDFVYSGSALLSSSFSYGSGAAIQSFSYLTNPNMDSGYTANDQHVMVDFFDNAPSKDSADTRFSFNDFSSWTIKNVSLADFTATFATSTPKPSPISGILSVSPYALTSIHPTPSNWVTGVAISPVPEPETYGMLLTGLGLVGFISRRRKNRSV